MTEPLDLTRLRYTYSLYETALSRENLVVEPKLYQLEGYVKWVHQYNLNHPGELETLGNEPNIAPEAPEGADQ
jgi:hypothetical protein